MQGKVKFFNTKRGFGFIVAEDGTEYFVHFSNIIMADADAFKTLKNDSNVTFDTKDSEKGLEAINVRAF